MSEPDTSHIKFENEVVDVPNVDLPLEDATRLILRCDNCGDRTVIQLPLAIEKFTKRTEAYITLHEDCTNG
jgi:hypothetical protein